MNDRRRRETASALRIGGVRPLAGSRRLASALKTVPRPITTNVMVSDALGSSTLRLVRPDDERHERGHEEHRRVDHPDVIAARLVIGSFGSRGGRCMTSGSPGSSAITTTPAAVTKNRRYSTISGVSATPSLMLNAVAATNSMTSASSCVIW